MGPCLLVRGSSPVWPTLLTIRPVCAVVRPAHARSAVFSQRCSSMPSSQKPEYLVRVCGIVSEAIVSEAIVSVADARGPAISVAIVRIAEARVPAILGDVVEEVVDDIRGDDVTDVLGLSVLERLEGHADALVVFGERGASAVARVDGRVDLHHQQLAAAVRVLLHAVE